MKLICTFFRPQSTQNLSEHAQKAKRLSFEKKLLNRSENKMRFHPLHTPAKSRHSSIDAMAYSKIHLIESVVKLDMLATFQGRVAVSSGRRIVRNREASSEKEARVHPLGSRTRMSDTLRGWTLCSKQTDYDTNTSLEGVNIAVGRSPESYCGTEEYGNTVHNRFRS
jgi:hypothetical protein